jgi:hypothetical protein
VNNIPHKPATKNVKSSEKTIKKTKNIKPVKTTTTK